MILWKLSESPVFHKVLVVSYLSPSAKTSAIVSAFLYWRKHYGGDLIVARKSKYESHVEPRLEEIKDWARNGATEEQIFTRLGVGHSAFSEYKRKYAELKDLLKSSKDFCDAKVESALYQAAVNGNTTAMIFWLKNRRADKWRESPALKDGASEESRIQVNITIADCAEAADE